MRPLTRSCFLLLLLGRLSLLASLFLGIFLSLLSPPFPLRASALILLSVAKVRISPTLTLVSLMIWYSGLTALFSLAKSGSGVLVNLSLCSTEATLSFSASPVCPFQMAQFVQVFLMKPAPFCKLFAGLGSTNKSATSLSI